MIRLVIAGSRTVTPTFEAISEAVISNFAPNPGSDHPRDFIAEVICGCADGADNTGKAWAQSLGIPVWDEPITDEDWKLGKFLGPRQRNRRMADRGDAAVAFWDGWSGGTSDLVCRMVARNKPCRVIPTKKRPPKNPRTKAS